MTQDDDLFRLSKHHIKQLIDKGYAEVKLPDGRKIVIDKNDLVFKKSEIDSYIEKLKSGNA